MGLVKSDHKKGLVTLTVITIIGFHCKMYIGHRLITLFLFQGFFSDSYGKKAQKDLLSNGWRNGQKISKDCQKVFWKTRGSKIKTKAEHQCHRKQNTNDFIKNK